MKKLGPEEPRATFALALDPPEMGEIGKSILLLKEVGKILSEDILSLSDLNSSIKKGNIPQRQYSIKFALMNLGVVLSLTF